MNKKSLIFSIIFFILLIVVTLYTVFSQYSFFMIVENFKKIKISFILICLFLIAMYFILQGLYMKTTLKSLNEDITLMRGIYYAIAEFFFTSVTPSSLGGQPAELYYMTKDKIPIRKSMIALILNTIMFKAFLLIFAIVILIFKPEYFFDNKTIVKIFFFLGLFIDTIVIVIGFLLMFHQGIVKKLLDIFYKIKFKLIKNGKNRKAKINQILKNYLEESKYIKNHPKEIIIGTLVTFLQRICLFSIPYVIYISFGLSGCNYFDLLLLQIFVSITIEGLPLPGGTGFSEHVLNNMYISIFGALAPTGMILNRTLSFYLPLLILLVIVIVVSKLKYSNN